jgi:signal peptidase II
VRFPRRGSGSSTRPEASVSADRPEVGTPATRRHLPLALGVAACWLLLDQLTKWWASNELDDRVIDLVWTLRLHLVTNTGASFSLGSGLGPFIGVVALVVVGILLWTGRSIGSRLGAVGLGLVLGGALGNLLDRGFRGGHGFMGGAVVDFIDVQWWPIFNVADMGVVIGAGLLLVASMRDADPADEPTEPSPTDEPSTPAASDRA